MIIHGNEVKEKLLQGIDMVANTVKPTLGPQARTVILQGNPPVIINDGITITRYISHEDPYIQMGIQLVQNLASQAQTESGDGTTTACVLAQALCHGMLEAEVEDGTLILDVGNSNDVLYLKPTQPFRLYNDPGFAHQVDEVVGTVMLWDKVKGILTVSDLSDLDPEQPNLFRDLTVNKFDKVVIVGQRTGAVWYSEKAYTQDKAFDDGSLIQQEFDAIKIVDDPYDTNPFGFV